MVCTNSRSILTWVAGSSTSRASEDVPVPMSSIDTPQPCSTSDSANWSAFTLTLGFPDENGAVVLARPDLLVPNGARLF